MQLESMVARLVVPMDNVPTARLEDIVEMDREELANSGCHGTSMTSTDKAMGDLIGDPIPTNAATKGRMDLLEQLLNKAKKEALIATAAARKKDKGADEVEPTITKREDAKREAERQNITNQTIVGTKEGVIEILKRLVGGDILDTVTKTADASRDKSIDEYKLHDVFQLAYDNAVRPEVDDVLEMLTEMYQYDFDFRKPIKHSMAQLRAMATRLKPFGINPAEPELMLILLANIHHAKEQDWGQEVRAAMAAIRKKYSYNHVHDATSMAYFLKELAGEDKL
jgi:hypothetical protein